MTTFLFYPGQPLRSEEKPAVIANLKRKGWLVKPKPSYNAALQHPPEWQNHHWVVKNKTPDELAIDNRKTWMSVAEFDAEFTDAQIKKLIKAARTNDDVELMRHRLMTHRSVVFADDPRIVAGMNVLVQIGVISAEDKDRILTRNP